MQLNYEDLLNENYSGENENLKRFVRIAQTALGKVEVSNLSKILTNSHHQFDNVPADVKDAINTIDTEKVVSIWDTEKNNIADYIFDRFDYVIKNNFIDNELVPLFDMLAQINFNSPFEAHFAKKIDEKILESLPNIISKTNNHENLCIYALLREKQRGEQIKVALIEESKRIEKQEKGKHWESLFNAVLKVFQDKKTSIALSSTYTLYKQVTNYNYHFFSEEQIDNLISAKYIQDRIAELPTDENGEILLSIETEEYKEIKWLFERKGILIRVLIIIFLRILLGKQMTKQECEEKVLTKLSKYLNLSILVLI